MNDDNFLIICAGTNDVYRTEFSIFKEEIYNLSELKQRIIMILIPPRKCPHTNYDIKKMNLKLQNLCRSIKNIDILNTFAFLKPEHIT